MNNFKMNTNLVYFIIHTSVLGVGGFQILVYIKLHFKYAYQRLLGNVCISLSLVPNCIGLHPTIKSILP